MQIPDSAVLRQLYGETDNSRRRFMSLAQNFQSHFSSDSMEFFSAPGRTEIIGNHTDHNGGRVIAASIHMDTIAAACPNSTNSIRIVSEGYPEKIIVNLDAPAMPGTVSDTQALVTGIAEAVRAFGYTVSGFDAYVSSNVINAAGVSSSASFEMLLCTILNHFFNADRITCLECAKAGQYAENHYWAKSSGLMDQLSCAVGGVVLMDFSDQENIRYQKLPFSFRDYGYEPVLVNTGKGHADLNREYSDVPGEMKEAAAILGIDCLGEGSLEKLLENLKKISNDRSALRALHFYEENRRVSEALQAILSKNFPALLSLMEESGHSSWEWLQNCSCPGNPNEQKIPLTLALTQLYLNSLSHSWKRGLKAGCCRVHGGGFAGVIQTVLPIEAVPDYILYLSDYVGKDNIYPLHIRSTGAVHLECRHSEL